MTATPRPLATHLWKCLALDIWPRPAAIVDWGIGSSDHLGALQAAIKGGASATDLDDAIGDGKKIMAMVTRYAPNSPYRDADFSSLAPCSPQPGARA